MSEFLFKCWVLLVLGAIGLSAVEAQQGRYLGLELVVLVLAFWVNEDFKTFKKHEAKARKKLGPLAPLAEILGV
jgi:hypothetical protein